MLSPAVALDKIASNVLASESFTALGACIFAGGFSTGVEQAGFDVAGHFEFPSLALGSAVSSQKWPVMVAPLQGANPSWQSAISLLKDRKAVPDLLYMNPPCVAYAQQGSHRKMEDDMMQYTRSCCDVGLMLGTDVWAWELVPGIYDDLQHGGREFLDSVAKRAAKAGYQTYYFLTSAALHGGFQNRKRFHFVASRFELDFDSAYASEPEEHLGWRTLGDALKIVEDAVAGGAKLSNHDLTNLSGGRLLDILGFCPPGGYLRDVKDELMSEFYKPRGQEWNGKRAGVTQVRGRRDRPCPVIIGGTSVIHPEEDRFLTVREAATVMGFPLDFVFSGTTSAGMAEVGKGLCAHNARFLSKTVAAGLERQAAHDKIVDPIVVDWRSRVNVPSMASTSEERAAWFNARHPELFAKSPELAQPQAHKKSGRPPGSATAKKSVARRKSVFISDPEKFDGLSEVLERLGLEPVLIEESGDEVSDDPAGLDDYLNAASEADTVVLADSGFESMLIAGSCLGGGGSVYFGHAQGVHAVPHPRVMYVTELTPSKLAARIATDLGIDPAAIVQEMLKGQDASSILELLLAQRKIA